MRQDEIQAEQPGPDVAKLVLPPATQIVLSDCGVDLTAIEMIDTAIAPVSLNRGMAQRQQFLDESGVALAVAGLGKRQKLSHREIARMRCGDMQESGFRFGVAEDLELGEMGFRNAHRHSL